MAGHGSRYRRIERVVPLEPEVGGAIVPGDLDELAAAGRRAGRSLRLAPPAGHAALGPKEGEAVDEAALAAEWADMIPRAEDPWADMVARPEQQS
jgi:hypothetical protein